jgi:hypothetical protein
LARLRPRSRRVFSLAAEVVSEARRTGQTIAETVEAFRRRGLPASRYGVGRYFAQDVERGRGGFLVAKPADRSYHGDLLIISTEGVVRRPVRGSRARTLAAAHAAANAVYLRGDDPGGEGLRRFHGRRVAGVELETDLDRLDLLQDSGQLDDFELYAVEGASG